MALQLNANDFAETFPNSPSDPEVPDSKPNLSILDPNADTPDLDKTITELLTKAYEKNPLLNEILTQLKEGRLRSKQLSLAECRQDDEGRLLYQERLYIPDHMPLKLPLIQDFHKTPAAGHPGRAKTLELLSQQYYWPRMHKDVDRFLRNCHTCQRSRTSRHAPFGILRPLPMPDPAWRHVSMDFVIGLL